MGTRLRTTRLLRTRARRLLRCEMNAYSGDSANWELIRHRGAQASLTVQLVLLRGDEHPAMRGVSEGASISCAVGLVSAR